MGAQLQQQQLEHQHQQVHYQQNNPTIQQNVTHVVSDIPQHQESVVYMPIPIRSKTSLTVDALIEKVWNDSWKKIEAINPGKENWKAQVLPLARIKKIMKLDDLIEYELEQLKRTPSAPSPNQQQRFMIAGEAPILLSKACELFIKEVSVRSWKHTEHSKRRTLQKQDVCTAICENEMFDFLIDIIPRNNVPAPQQFEYANNPPDNHAPANTVDNTQQFTNNPTQESTLLNAEKRLKELQQMQADIINTPATQSMESPNMQWIAEAAAEAVKVVQQQQDTSNSGVIDNNAIHDAVAQAAVMSGDIVDQDVTNVAADVVLTE